MIDSSYPLLRITSTWVLISCCGAVAATPATVSFDDITVEAGVAIYSNTFGAAFSDIDNDGDDDLILSRHAGGPALFLNQNGMVFSDATHLLPATWGDRHGITVVDLDNDGDRDLAIVCGGADGVGNGCSNQTIRSLLTENGKLAFANISGSSGLGGESELRSRHLLPMAGSGGRRVDLYLACVNRVGYPNEYYVNYSSADQIRFVADTRSDLRMELRSDGLDLVADLDRDGDQDIIVINSGQILLLRREGDGFTIDEESLLADINRVSAIAAGDLNNDGYPDLFVGTTPAWGPSDHTIVAGGRLHFVMLGLAGDTHDAISFRATGEELTANLAFKPGLNVNSPAAIFIGAERINPESTRFTTTTAHAAGSPTNTSAPGTYIWYEPETGLWQVLWRHLEDKPGNSYRGSFESEEIPTVTMIDTEQRPASEPATDLLFVNHGGRFQPWPDAPPLPHNKQTAVALIEDLDNNGHSDLACLRRGQTGDYNGDPLLVLNYGPEGFVVLETNDLIIAEDDLYSADQLISGLVNSDGLLDLFYSNGWGVRPGSTGPTRLFLNTTETTDHFLVLELVGWPSNRDAIGAQVEVYRDSEEPLLLGYRELGSGFHRSQRSHHLHFGLGSEPGPVRVRIIWPSGNHSWHTLEVDHRHRIEEPGASYRRGGGRHQ
jgi:hypothetical protein